ncbi:hypothetical protein ABZ863_04560 [Saccharomonospora sp. NPDC046836]|uniref:hypothetical protein n=1 Tax=Saccharomonospora sp. NPDC046836 TaxID=3156921 RepID=UPI00340C21D4
MNRYRRRPLREWVCPCSSTLAAEQMPACNNAACLRRWWLVFGIPCVLLIGGLLVAGGTIWADPPPACPDGFTQQTGTTCVRG